MNSIVLGMYLLINRNIKFYTTDLKLTLHITDTNFDSLHKSGWFIKLYMFLIEIFNYLRLRDIFN